MVQLIVYRAVQGLGAGVMMPLVQIIAGDLYSVEKRGRIQALFTSMWMLSGLMAPVLGAFFVEVMSWRWIFFINVPVCLCCLAMIIPYRDVYERDRKPVDVLGAILFVAGATSLLFVTAVERYHLVWLTIGIVVLTCFVIHERRYPSPMIPAGMFARPAITWMLVNNFIICVAIFGLPNYLPLYLQDQGFSVLESGLVLAFISVGWMVASVSSGKGVNSLRLSPSPHRRQRAIVDRRDMAGVTRWIASYLFLFAGLIVLGTAFGLIFTGIDNRF